MQSQLNEPENETWLQIAPLLDTAIADLNDKDRHAIVLRFFEKKSMSEVGQAIGANENAAKTRVNRALEKLRKFFTKRGVTQTAAAIAGVVAANSVQAAPIGLAISVTAVAAKGALVSGSTLTLIKGALKLMAWTKIKAAVVIGVVALIGTTVSVKVVSHLTERASAAKSYPGDWIWEANSTTLNRVPPILLLRPSTLPAQAVPFDMFGKNRYLARGKTVRELIVSVWSQKNSSLELVFTTDLPAEKYDFIAADQARWWDALESEIKKRFSLVGGIESRGTNEIVVIKRAN